MFKIFFSYKYTNIRFVHLGTGQSVTTESHFSFIVSIQRIGFHYDSFQTKSPYVFFSPFPMFPPLPPPRTCALPSLATPFHFHVTLDFFPLLILLPFTLPLKNPIYLLNYLMSVPPYSVLKSFYNI